jgi:hypothetical protein
MNRKYLRVRGAADVAKLSHWTVRRYLTDGKLTRYKIGGVTLVDEGELLALIHAETPAQAAVRNLAAEARSKAGAR